MEKKHIRAPHRETLREDLAQSLLNVPVAEEGSIWEKLQAARKELGIAVDYANRALQGSPLTEILAEHAQRLSNRRGYPRIVVDADGAVKLEVYYDAASVPAATPTESRPGRKWSTTLPSIEALRKEATRLGIDAASFGKAKLKLMDAIQAAQKAPVPPPQDPPKPKMVKTAPALGPVKMLQPEVTLTPSPLVDDDDGVASLFGDAEPTTPDPRRVAPPISAPARTLKGRSLSAVVSHADDDVDLNALLTKPAPPPPQGSSDD